MVSIATFITCGSLYINRAKTANQVSEQLCNNKMVAFDLWCKMNDNAGYDIEFFVWNQYEDSKRAAELMEDIVQLTNAEMSKGSRFPVIYIFCATTFFLLATSNLCMLLGIFCAY